MVEALNLAESTMKPEQPVRLIHNPARIGVLSRPEND